jgi:hypothetical protein
VSIANEEDRPGAIPFAGETEWGCSGLALYRASGQNSAVHKDKPPGIFDLTERSMRYAAGFCFVVGFLVSVIVRIGVALAHEHFSQATPWSGV